MEEAAGRQSSAKDEGVGVGACQEKFNDCGSGYGSSGVWEQVIYSTVVGRGDGVEAGGDGDWGNGA